MRKILFVLSSIAAMSSASAKDCQLKLYYGTNIAPAVQERINNHMTPFCDTPLKLILGNHEDNKVVVNDLGPEAYRAVSEVDANGKLTIFADGNPVASDFHQGTQYRKKGSMGAHYSAYAVLEHLGFSFLHPLKPSIPKTLNLSEFNTDEAPFWPARGIHLHTMHPLELTNLLNGWGIKGYQDNAGWESQLPHWDTYMEWLIANKQNQVQWVILEKKTWANYAQSPERQAKIKRIVDRAHEFGMYVGIDAAIALEQQNAFRLIREFGNREHEIQQLHDRIDWLMETGLDYLSTEMGSSEFTNPGPELMLSWMDDFTKYLKSKWKADADIKVHVTKNQVAWGFKDPVTGVEPSNFNFLTHYADPNLTALVHTVQHYSLTDPAPTYHRKNFKSMLEFLKVEAGRRKILFYPETAYWVSFDIDVPLFLPVYAHRRLEDLRMLAQMQEAGELGVGENKGSKIQGQMIFSSGWEWGYWLNDVIAARAAWDPKLDQKGLLPALNESYQEALKNIDIDNQLAGFLTDYSEMQKDLLIYGKYPGKLRAPKFINKRNGQAYLQGWESWDDINSFADKIPFAKIELKTQPDRYSPKFVKDSRNYSVYDRKVAPLLKVMKDVMEEEIGKFSKLNLDFDHELVDELYDSVQITTRRAQQVYVLYEAGRMEGHNPRARRAKKEMFYQAQDILKDAERIVRKREQHYRVPFELIGGWGDNATAYKYGYLWTVHSLSYWYRDENKFTNRDKTCAHNIVDPLINISYEGRENERLMAILEKVKRVPLTGWLDGCMSRPEEEPVYTHHLRPRGRKASRK